MMMGITQIQLDENQIDQEAWMDTIVEVEQLQLQMSETQFVVMGIIEELSNVMIIIQTQEMAVTTTAILSLVFHAKIMYLLQVFEVQCVEMD